MEAAVNLIINLLLFTLMSFALTGCRSHKTATVAEASVMNDTIAAIITETSDENIDKSEVSSLSSDSLNIHFSADSITVGNMVIYGPKFVADAHGTNVHHAAAEKKLSADSVAAHVFTSSKAVDNKTEDIKHDTNTGPSVGDIFQIAAFMVVLILAVVMVRKFIFNRHK